MNNIFAAIWDVDGTLVDTAELHFAAWRRVAEESGRSFSRDDFTATFGRRNPEIIRSVFDPTADEAEITRIGEQKEAYYRDSTRAAGVSLLPGVRKLLDELHAAGWRQAVGSSAPRANLELLLSATDTARYFGSIVAMEDTSRGKPDPQVFQLAAERLGVPARSCVVLEDAVAGVQAAANAGMSCVAVTFVGHHPEPSLRAAGAGLVAPTLEEVSESKLRLLIERR